MKRILALCLLFAFLLAGCKENKRASKRNSDDDKTGSGILSALLGTEETGEDERTEADVTEDSDEYEETEALDETEEEDWSHLTTTAAVSSSQSEALESAYSYLRVLSFSYEGLIEQLEYEGYSHDDAVYAADNCGADWFEEAEESAASYLEYSAFSYQDLVEQLEYEGFTHEQAVHGVDAVYDQSGDSNSGVSASKQNALKSAESYLKYSAFSYEGLVEQLEYEGYSKEDATYAADNCGADWYAEAAESAESYLKYMDFTRADLIDQLEYEGFTYDQAVYGVEQNGL